MQWDFAMDNGCRNVLLGVSGSVAALRTEELVSHLTQANYNVVVVMTSAAHHFVDKSRLTVPVYTDSDEYGCWRTRGDDVLHIKLKNWAQIFLIAPLSANTLAKIAGGLCDNLLTCIARAWYFEEPIGIFAPAMNSAMWKNPLTSKHVDVLRNTLNWHMINPVCKTLVCGEFGEGAMEEPFKIVQHIEALFRQKLQCF
ncbi:unnamed protein product [Mesocestoides corti]|uniref:Flavoprotein domain-containing protein n=1 Tax=Mesocestoides corti TaxID=53468 RepID=A0A0R3U6M4_MESCO|nr:unnamed protein product [Mesocestoides corti]